jgi:hypothetical protein
MDLYGSQRNETTNAIVMRHQRPTDPKEQRCIRVFAGHKQAQRETNRRSQSLPLCQCADPRDPHPKNEPPKAAQSRAQNPAKPSKAHRVRASARRVIPNATLCQQRPSANSAPARPLQRHQNLSSRNKICTCDSKVHAQRAHHSFQLFACSS